MTEPTSPFFHSGEKFKQIILYRFISYGSAVHAYDSLGEAYLINGDTELAIQNYKKSLELNPKNTGAIEILKKLEEK